MSRKYVSPSFLEHHIVKKEEETDFFDALCSVPRGVLHRVINLNRPPSMNCFLSALRVENFAVVYYFVLRGIYNPTRRTYDGIPIGTDETLPYWGDDVDNFSLKKDEFYFYTLLTIGRKDSVLELFKNGVFPSDYKVWNKIFNSPYLTAEFSPYLVDNISSADQLQILYTRYPDETWIPPNNLNEANKLALICVGRPLPLYARINRIKELRERIKYLEDEILSLRPSDLLISVLEPALSFYGERLTQGEHELLNYITQKIRLAREYIPDHIPMKDEDIHQYLIYHIIFNPDIMWLYLFILPAQTEYELYKKVKEGDLIMSLADRSEPSYFYEIIYLARSLHRYKNKMGDTSDQDIYRDMDLPYIQRKEGPQEFTKDEENQMDTIRSSELDNGSI